MEGEACQYSKFGFCKFKDMCERKHFTEECDKNSKCQDTNTCDKRQPKNCNGYYSGNCRFKNDCAYKHQSNFANQDQCEIQEKVKFLENIVLELSLKLLNMEKEVKVLKQNKSGENPSVEKIYENETKSVKENLSSSQVIDTEPEVSKEDEVEAVEVFPEIDLSMISDKKEEGESQAAVNDKKVKEKFLFCDYCSYKCKKKGDLQKHKNVKHGINTKGHQCIKCRENVPSLSNILEHDQKEHSDKKFQKTTSFVFSDSMLDEFDV